MGIDVFPIGSRVQVTNYSPWRGLRGTILNIHMIVAPDDESFCFYLVAVDGAHVKEPIWFGYTEVELIAPPQVDAQLGEPEHSLREKQEGST